MKTFGRNSNGKITICRAKPENIGRYNCQHSEHFELSETDLKNGAIQKMNEAYFEKLYNDKSLNKNEIPEQFSDQFSNSVNSSYISKEELKNGAAEISSHFDAEAFNFIREFYAEVGEDLPATASLNYYGHRNSRTVANAIKKIHSFLESDAEAAKNMREFLGKDVNLRDLSEILVLQVGSMSSAIKWSPVRGKSNVRRAILTALNNDMNKDRYVASVLFFGGRCCYCNNVLRKGKPITKQASGEHLTPISPDKHGDSVGGTMFGNVCLACVRCNKERANKELTNFIQETPNIKKEDKPKVLARIQNFRKFALYQDYSPEYSKKVEQAIKEVDDYEKSFRNPDGSFNKEDMTVRDKIRARIKETVYDLQVQHF